MRCPESKIKAAILHADEEIRVHAIHYYDKSRIADSTVMPMVIQAVETYSKQQAYRLIGPSRRLPQSEATVDWVIKELNAASCDKYESYAYTLSMVLAEADPALMIPRKSDILDARHFRSDVQPIFNERLEMHSWDEPECWKKLLEFCEQDKDKAGADEVDLSHAHRIVEALARFGRDRESEVVDRLGIEAIDHHGDVMYWLEPMLVRLAGLAKIESAIPPIVSRLRGDDDILREECSEALVSIGTSAVLDALAAAYSKENVDFRISVAFLLADFRSDEATEKCCGFYQQERDERVKLQLASALLTQFAYEGIEIARKFLLGRELDWESTGLRDDLLETCTVMEERFPEYDEWQKKRRVEKQDHWRRVKELENDPTGMMLFALEKLAGKKAPAIPKPRVNAASSSIAASLRSSTSHAAPAKKKTGRNDPCPCGSGKKFKACCLKKQWA